MVTRQPAIKVTNVSKVFKLPHEKQSSIKGLFINMFRGKRTYEKQQALNDVSFEVKKGEFFGIVGRNGSGKSTLLKMLAGIYQPTSGHIQVNGKLTPFIELGVGFNPELTGRENVFLNGALLGFNRKEMLAMYDEIVEFAELEKFMDQKLKNYSSGMQVRLAFSIAIRANTEILVLDEVLAVGDANFQKKCFEYFREIKRQKKTVILVSHDMESVRKFSDRAMLLENGKIVIVGDPDEVSDEYIRSNIDLQSAQKETETPPEISEKDIYIKTVKILGKDGKQNKNVVSGEKLKIQVEYVVIHEVDELNIGLGLHADPNGYVLSYNTQMDDYKTTKGKSAITLGIDKLPLLNGHYYFNVVIFGADEFMPFDFKSRAASFDISNTGVKKRYRGIIDLEHTWME